MLHFAHCHEEGIIAGQQSDHKVNEVAPRQIHAQWAVCPCPKVSPMFVPLGSLHREGPSQGLGRPSDRKLDDKKEHKLLHKYSRATHREACALTTHHIQSSLSAFYVVRLFSWDSCQRGENFVASI